MLTSSVALLLACTAFIVYELINFRKTMSRELVSMADIIEDSSIAPLEFKDPGAGRDVLKALEANPRIMAAAIYDEKGKIFAAYRREDVRESSLPASPSPKGSYLESGSMKVFFPVTLNKETTAYIYIQSDLKHIYDSMRQYAIIVFLVFIISSFAALLLSSKLQESISGPIHDLAQTADRVSWQKNYSIRAIKQSEDELGHLIDRFNEMLSHIQERDWALEKIREGLEETVKARTGDLEREVTVRRQAEDQLKLYAAELVRSNNALKDFAAIASHDLQEPLRKIIAFGDRLRSTCTLGEQGENYLGRMQKATHRMQDFIHDLLEYSKVSSKPRQMQIINLKDILSEVLFDLETRIAQTQGSVEVGELPTIEADKLQMHQFFQNMISNALKFHKSGFPPHVSVKCRAPEPGQWEITIQDNGIGFDMKYSDRIMKPFQRLTGRTEYEGSGMGLAICQKIVDNHGGKLKVDSALEKGACFTVLFPEKQQKER